MKTPPCPICHKTTNAVVLNENFFGYLSGTFFPIFSCKDCKHQYTDLTTNVETLYEKIYAKTAPGYERYYRYAQEVLTDKNPLLYLSSQEAAYYPIYNFLKNKKGLNVLEVGSGLGYTTYAVNQSGNTCTGIDISADAVEKANKRFGKHFHTATLDGFKKQSEEKFDLIIATELIEHLQDPTQFVGEAETLLKPGGTLLITTPNKCFYPSDAVWQTDLPPVHFQWFSPQSLQKLGEKVGLTYAEVSYQNSHIRQNTLLEWFYWRKPHYTNHQLFEESAPTVVKRSMIANIIKTIAESSLVMSLCNAYYKKANSRNFPITAGLFQKAANE